MYSQSKGRQFSEGEQEKLVEYLTQTCPLDPSQETEQDRKLNLILSKVQVREKYKLLESKINILKMLLIRSTSHPSASLASPRLCLGLTPQI